jgi:demethylmenaquinone methyltransferase/2-methoxy-6-polyprenyl-1,4-benzoquinol methylase
MFDQAASGYDRAERITALGSGAWYRRDVLRRNGLQAGMTLLDVAAGTGLVAAEGQRLIGPSGRLLALDPSPGMLAELRKKLDVETIEAYAESIPLPENHVDFVSMGYALRHVGDLDQAFGEYLRVLRPGGRACIMEISRPESRLGQLALRAYIRGVVPFLARLTRGQANVKLLWEYYGETIDLAVEPERILDAMRRSGFVDVECSVTYGIFREYLGRKP